MSGGFICLLISQADLSHSTTRGGGSGPSLIYQLITSIRSVGPRTPQTQQGGWINIPFTLFQQNSDGGVQRSGQAQGWGPCLSVFKGGACFHSTLGND